MRLPSWLEAIIVAIASYLKGRIDQADIDAAATQKQTTAAQKTVEDAARDVGGMTDDEVREELGQWRRS